jgi:hypothetical protein
MRHSALFVTASVVAGAAGAAAQTANFDSATEGTFSTTWTENGLFFHDADPRIPGSPPVTTLNIDNAEPTLTGMPGFTPSNVLNFGGYAPGPGCSFGRIGSLTITPPSPGSNASIEVFEFFSDPANTITFAAYLGGQEVARQSQAIPGNFVVNHLHFEVSAAQFDELKLFGSGPSDQGVFFGVIDTVSVSSEGPACYPNCDGSTAPPVLNVNDFICFQAKFAAGDSYANCDGSTTPPVLNVNDFICFQQRFAAGCP